MMIFDAHLDLSMNAMDWNRDLRRPITEIRDREKNMKDKPDRGNGVVSLPELRKANIGLVVATQIARSVTTGNPLPGWHSPEQAWAQTQAQLAWYKAMEDEGEMIQIDNIDSLTTHVNSWNQEEMNLKKPVGYILSLEGADSIVTLKHLERAYRYGLRIVGPAHYGPGRYANGTNASGGMNKEGLDFLREMERLDLILDATHLCDEAFWQALNHFKGPVWASHNNCRALVNHHRQFSDDQIKALIDRGAVIGGAMDAWMMVPGWIRGKSTPRELNCNLEKLINHLDHICQIAGNTLHIGIGSDLDGGFGREQCPIDIETIADERKIPDLLKKRGYTDDDVFNIMQGNWLRFLKGCW